MWEKRSEQKEANKRINGKAFPSKDKIFSYGTYRAYLKEGILFAKWAKEHYSCRTLEEARQYTGKYLNDAQAQNLSAWTVRAKAAALGKMYGCAFTELGSVLPIRKRGDVIKNRSGDRTASGHYSEEKHADIKEFCQACGLRRKELQNLRVEDVSRNQSGAVIIHVKQGKGGRERWVKTLSDAPLRIAQKAAREDRRHIFQKIPTAAPIHVYRQDFAKALYASVARKISDLPRSEIYQGKADKRGEIYDKKAMQEVSHALGHSRIDVVTHYI